MKGKRYTTEDKLRILREADGGKTPQEVCRERNVAEQTFYRWKRIYGMMEVNEARRLKELGREHPELKKMLAEEMPENRVLSFVCEKSCELGIAPGVCAGSSQGRRMFATASLPVSTTGPLDLSVSQSAADTNGATV